VQQLQIENYVSDALQIKKRGTERNTTKIEVSDILIF